MNAEIVTCLPFLHHRRSPGSALMYTHILRQGVGVLIYLGISEGMTGVGLLLDYFAVMIRLLHRINARCRFFVTAGRFRIKF